MDIRIALLLVLAVCMTSSMVSWARGQDTPNDAPDQALTDYASLDRFIRRWSDHTQGGQGQWTFQVEQTPLIVLADQQHNRMRIISPIADARDLDESQLRKMMQANFDRALDARYAIWKDQVWAAFVHPMAELSEKEFHDAVGQVIQLRHNYGGSYSSTDLKFGGNE